MRAHGSSGGQIINVHTGRDNHACSEVTHRWRGYVDAAGDDEAPRRAVVAPGQAQAVHLRAEVGPGQRGGQGHSIVGRLRKSYSIA